MALSPAYAKYPEHTLTFEDEPAALRVSVGDVVIAETTRGLVLLEGRYPAVVYVPREDVRMEHLSPSEGDPTFCPFKGDATYYDFIAGDSSVQQIGWSYEDPFDQMAKLRSHLAFYADRALLESFNPKSGDTPTR